jgi:Ran GTPase-activating protein (RanGAP) involved in mRNA processing and transport
MRSIQQYITDTYNSSVTIIELLNCGISPLGCEFVSRMFDTQLPSKISILTLDYNAFGNEGFANLMTYIEKTRTLNYLSLAYCGIDEFGIKFAKNYLESSECTLKKLILQGNPIKNSGASELFTMLLSNLSLEEININNIQFGGDAGTVDNLKTLMATTNSLLAYQMKFNFLNDAGISLNLYLFRF